MERIQIVEFRGGKPVRTLDWPAEGIRQQTPVPQQDLQEDCLRSRVAIHEAGHAVMAYKLGMNVLSIRISPGHVLRAEGTVVWRPRYCELNRAPGIRLHAEAQVRLAGLVAEFIYLGLDPSDPECLPYRTAEYEEAVQQAHRTHQSPTLSACSAAVESAWFVTARMLGDERTWKCVLKLARQLLVDNMISGKKGLEIIGGLKLD